MVYVSLHRANEYLTFGFLSISSNMKTTAWNFVILWHLSCMRKSPSKWERLSHIQRYFPTSEAVLMDNRDGRTVTFKQSSSEAWGIQLSNWFQRCWSIVYITLEWMPRCLSNYDSALVRSWIGATWQQTFTWASVDKDLLRHMPSVVHTYVICSYRLLCILQVSIVSAGVHRSQF